MNKKILPLAIAATILMMSMACNNSKKDKEGGSTGTETENTAATATEAGSQANQPKSFKATVSPDTLLLGKSSEAKIKIIGATAVALTDPDGKDKGIELVIKLQATNKQFIGQGSSLSVSYSDARLQLDNGTSITVKNGTDYLRAQPEATSNIESWTFEIPTGAKPTALNLFMDGTRATTSVVIE